MAQHKDVAIEGTAYFHFAANDTSGSGGDGATPLCDVRLCGAAAAAAPVLSPTPVLLSEASYPAGCHEVAVAATAGNGFAAGSEYAIFCALTVDSQDPSGFVGTLRVTAAADTLHDGAARVMDVTDAAAVKAVTGTVGPVTGAVGSVAGNVDGNVTGDVGGNVDGSVGSVTGAVGSVAGNVDGSVASATALGAQAKLDVTAAVPTAVAIATAVWNAVTSGMTTVGSIGKKLADWTILTSQAIRDAMKLAPAEGVPTALSVDAHLDDILEDTGTTLPASIALLGGGGGANTITVTVEDDDSTPLAGATVVIRASASGAITTQQITDANGIALLGLDDATYYTQVVRLTGYTHDEEELVVSGTTAATLTMTAIVVDGSVSVDSTRIYAYPIDIDGQVNDDTSPVLFTARLSKKALTSTGVLVDTEVDATLHDDEYWYVDVIPIDDLTAADGSGDTLTYSWTLRNGQTITKSVNTADTNPSNLISDLD